MLSLSQSVGYAVKALTCLEMGTCETHFVRDIARCSGVPAAYLSKIFTKLVSAHILTSKRGWKGGTRLARQASEISLLDIALVIDGDQWIGDSLLGLVNCEQFDDCPTHGFWKVERERIENELRRTSIADVVVFESKRRSAWTVSSPAMSHANGSNMMHSSRTQETELASSPS